MKLDVPDVKYMTARALVWAELTKQYAIDDEEGRLTHEDYNQTVTHLENWIKSLYNQIYEADVTKQQPLEEMPLWNPESL